MRSFPLRTRASPATSLNQKPALVPVLSHSGRRRASAVPPDLPPTRSRWTLVGSAIGLHPDALFCASARERIRAFRVAAGSQSRPALPVRRLRATTLRRCRYDVLALPVFLLLTRST